MKKFIATMVMMLTLSLVPAAAVAGDSGIRPDFSVERTCADTKVVVNASKDYTAMSFISSNSRKIFVDFYVAPGKYFLDAKREGRYTVSEAGQSAHVVVRKKVC